MTTKQTRWVKLSQRCVGEMEKAQKAIFNAEDRCHPLTKELNRKTKKVRFGKVSMTPTDEQEQKEEKQDDWSIQQACI